MFFPLSAYIIVLGLGWFAWRRHWKLDRKEVLFWYILSVCVTGVGVLITLIPSQEWASDYGNRVLSLTVVIVVIAVVSGVLVYLFWHTSTTVLDQSVTKPTVLILDANVSAQPLQIRYKRRVTTIDARFLIVKVSAANTTAFKLKVAGTITPEMPEDSLVPFSWFLRPRRLIKEILVSVTPTKSDGMIEIAYALAENVLQTECDLPPETSSPVVVGFTLKDSSLLCFGESIIDLPYEGRIRVNAINVPYGILADKWFKISATSWDKIEFTPEA